MPKRRVPVRSAVLFSLLLPPLACAEGAISEFPGGPNGSSEPPPSTIPASDEACPGASPDVAARNGWRGGDASEAADDALRFEVKARPTTANLNGLVALGAEDIDGFDKAAIAVRFAADGLVDVRDGATYASDMAYTYEPGVWYNVGIAANLDTQTYDVEIGPCGEARETLIKNASFRDNAEELSTWAVWSSQTAALEVSTPAWMASGGCVPATCASLGQVCGQPGDGCGGTLDCGGCGNNELCDSGLCVEELVTTPPPPTCVPDTCEVLSIECGVRSDGCGGYLACGDCPSGSSCNSGVCVQDPITDPPPPVCVPGTCQSLDRQCGTVSDGCGGALGCGSCQSGYSCSSGYCVPDPVSTPPPADMDDFSQFIRDNAAGGIVLVPNGTYYVSDVKDFAPDRPLVLVAESKGGVVVTRRDGAVEGETDLHLDRVQDIAFVGIHFRYVTLHIDNSSDVHLWYTFHTYPPQQKPRPRHKVCGGGRSPDGILMSNVRNLKFHGIELDRIGNDGLKLAAIRDAQIVGASFTNIDHQNYQTDTTATEAASCGHKSTDKFYHSDAIQIYPGDVHNFVMSDSFSDRHLMLQVEKSGQSVSGFRIQHSWLSNPLRDCITINTRVKSAAGNTPMELIVVDSTSWCEPKPERWHFYTGGTASAHQLLVGNVTYETSKNAPSPTPADHWKAAFPYEAWGCFVTEDIGWTQLGASCTHSGFPSYRGPSTTPTTRVIHSY